MTDISEIAAELEASRSQLYCGFQNISASSHPESRRSASYSRSTNLTEECSGDNPLGDSNFRNSIEDNAPEKVSFTRKISRELVALVNSEKDRVESREVENFNGIRWEEVSKKISRGGIKFSSRDCYIQYCNVESKGINKGIWGADEDRKLLALATSSEECGWIKIAHELDTNRTPLQCLQRYQQALNPKLVNSNEWTSVEDGLLRKAVEIYGTKSWQNVSTMISGRSAVQCGARYRKSSKSRDDIVDGSWAAIDERRLFLAAIAYEIPTSSIFKKTPAEINDMLLQDDLTARRRGNGDSGMNSSNDTVNGSDDTDKRKKKKYNLTKVTAAIPAVAVVEGSTQTPKLSQLWAAVAKLVPGKNDERCREKWVNSLDPSLLFGPFTPDEYKLLKILVQKSGVGNWAEKSLWFPGRTDANLMARWKTGCMSDVNERKDYKALAKLRRDLSVPVLSRGSMSSSSLSERDYTPVLSADLAAIESVDDAERASLLPGGEGSMESSLQGQRDVRIARTVLGSSSSSSSSSGRGRTHRSRGSISSAEEADTVTSSRSSQGVCSICDHSLHNLRSSQQQPLIRCTVCQSQYHESCCSVSETRTSLFICSSCETASPHGRNTPGSEHGGPPDVRLKTVQNQRKKRGRRTESEDFLAPPPKLLSRKSSSSASGSRAAKTGTVSEGEAVILERTVVSNAIHPNILAALEECESCEFT